MIYTQTLFKYLWNEAISKLEVFPLPNTYVLQLIFVSFHTRSVIDSLIRATDFKVVFFMKMESDHVLVELNLQIL